LESLKLVGGSVVGDGLWRADRIQANYIASGLVLTSDRALQFLSPARRRKSLGGWRRAHLGWQLNGPLELAPMHASPTPQSQFVVQDSPWLLKPPDDDPPDDDPPDDDPPDDDPPDDDPPDDGAPDEDPPSDGAGPGPPDDEAPELVVAPLDPGPAGLFAAVELQGVVSGWIACGPIPFSPVPPDGAPPEVPKPPPVGTPPGGVPVAPPPDALPAGAVPPLWSEQLLPVWPPPESEPEHAAAATASARTANDRARLKDSFMKMDPFFRLGEADGVNMGECGTQAHSGSEIASIPGCIRAQPGRGEGVRRMRFRFSAWRGRPSGDGADGDPIEDLWRGVDARGGADAVAPRRLRGVHRAVCTVDDRVERLSRTAMRHADRDRDGDRLAVRCLDAGGLDRTTDPLGHAAGIALGCVGESEHELLAAPTRGAVVRPGLEGQECASRAYAAVDSAFLLARYGDARRSSPVGGHHMPALRPGAPTPTLFVPYARLGASG
jgi:hypothetical protein